MIRAYGQLSMIPLLVAASCPVAAAECAGVAMPDAVTVNGQVLSLNGMGLRAATFLKVKVYVAGLYLTGKSADASAIIGSTQPWQLVLNFVREVDTADINKAWREGFEKNARDQLTALQDRIARLEGYMQDFREGSTLTFSHVPGEGTEIIVDGVRRGIIEGSDFGAALISIWLGDPPNTGLKEGLLGGPCG